MNRFRSKRKKAELSRNNLSSSIRGKISAPIPIEDDEFPIRAPGTNLATPIHEDADKEIGLPSSITPEPGTTADVKPTESPSVVRPVQAPALQELQTPARQSGSLVSRFQELDLSTTPDKNCDKPQRTKSTLKSVLARLFGGKKRNAGDSGSYGLASSSPRAGQHLSDPVTRTTADRPSPHERAKSAPINAFNRALRSHSVNGTSPPQILNDESEGEAERKTRPRRPTTPSHLYTPTKSFGFPEWKGLTPRPSSGMGRAGTVEEPQIGFAVTMGSHPHRRSRSLGHLPPISIASQGLVRRRSEDIRFWRESYDPDALSPMSSQDRPETEQHAAVEQEYPHLNRETNGVYKQAQPFNFGPMGEMAGMKITQAASLESRVSNLEERLERMENAVSQLQDQLSRSGMPLQSPSRGRSVPERNWSTPRPATESSDFSPLRLSKTRYQQHHSPQDDTAFSSPGNLPAQNSRPSTESTHQSNGHSYEHLSQPSTVLTSPDHSGPEPADASSLSVDYSGHDSTPLSTYKTFRDNSSSSPLHNSMPLSKNGSLTAHHYSALLNLIQAEQATREKLEDQVRELQHQLNAVMSRAPYPTPSPEHGGRARKPMRSSSPRRAQFSVFEHGSSDIDSEDEDEYGRYKEYGTPNGESGQFIPNGRLEAEAEVEELEGHRTPRTLSLSQMTLRKEVMHSVNF